MHLDCTITKEWPGLSNSPKNCVTVAQPSVNHVPGSSFKNIYCSGFSFQTRNGKEEVDKLLNKNKTTATIKNKQTEEAKDLFFLERESTEVRDSQFCECL